MKILIVSSADSVTGAARAATRLHRLQIMKGLDSTMLVGSRTIKHWRILGPEGSIEKTLPHLMPRLSSRLMRLQRSENPILHSPALFSGPAFRRIQRQPADVINLHWVNDDFMSIRQIGRLDKPVVWTLHDSWAFCGAEHHPASADDTRYVDGYLHSNRGPGHKGVDIDRMIWNRKLATWRRRMHIVTPSRWLADCARRSRLMRDWPISVIPNALPLDVFRPWDQRAGRAMFDLPPNRPLVLFGAVGGTSSPSKGWAYLREALLRLSQSHPDAAAVVLGQQQPQEAVKVGMDVFYIGHLFDDASLAMLYSAVDAVIVPSRLENLPQMATEAQSCGVPVVGFNAGGMPDVVEHGETGYLAAPYDPEELAHGMSWVLARASQNNLLGLAARARAEKIWDQRIVHERYLEAYRSAIEGTL